MQFRKDSISLFKGIDLATRKLPLLIADSEVSGPKVWLTAAIHGDEVTGVSVIQSIIKRLEKTPLRKGILYTVPVLNPSGFETRSRTETFNMDDLNRRFPGNPEGTTSERIAHIIFELITQTKPDYVIDLHTDSANSIAYAMVDLPTSIKGKPVLKEAIKIAQTTGLPWGIDRGEMDGYLPQNCLTGSLLDYGIPAVTLELGGPMVVSEQFRKTGIDALWGFLSAIDMVRGPVKSVNNDLPDIIYAFEKRINCQTTGIIEYRVKPGEKIDKEQVLGKIRNVYAETIEVIRSPFAGLLFSHEDQSVTFPGQALFTLGSQTNLKDIANLG